MAPPAVAQGAVNARVDSYFSWTFDGKCCITSREWTTTLDRDIWIDVDRFTPCSISGLGQVKVRAWLYRETWGGWSLVGSYREFVACGGGDYVWTGVDPGTFKFYFEVISPWRDRATYHAEGTLAYDGSRT